MTIANHEVSAQKSEPSLAASGAITVADRIATVELGPTKSWRDDPNIA